MKYTRLLLNIIVVAALFVGISYGQKISFLPTANAELGAFKTTTGKWQILEDVAMHPTKADVLITKPFQNTSGVLLGTVGAAATTPMPADETILSFEFMLSPSATGVAQLPFGINVKLNDNWGQAAITTNTCGTTNEMLVNQNVCRAPGLWQTLRVSYSASKIEWLKLNDVLLLENILLTPNTTTDLRLSVLTGTIAFRDFEYSSYKKLINKPLTLKNLKYQLYKGYHDSPRKVTKEVLIKAENTTKFTQEWGYGQREYSLAYEGEIDVTETDSYTFNLMYMGHAGLWIDDNYTLITDYNLFLQDVRSKAVTLSKGTHKIRVFYNKVSWRRAALGLSVAPLGARPYNLHEAASVPEADPLPTLAVEAESEPEMIRSFVQMPNETTKRTHVLSVGAPSGTHYSYDLARGAWLQQWRGAFADVTEMWHERGEPQLLKTMGATTLHDGKPHFATLINPDAPWPDSITNDLTYRGLVLDINKYPTIRYTYKDQPVTESIVPTTYGFDCIVTAPQSGDFYIRAATGKKITFVSAGFYTIDNQGYIKTSATKAYIRDNAKGEQELLLMATATATMFSVWW